jgi:hypothetical protein
MTLKERVATLIRNNEIELAEEIQRVKDEMAETSTRTKRYKELLEIYNTLLEREEKLKEAKACTKKYILGGVLSVAGIIFYRKLIDTSADPFFRDLGKDLIKIGKI